MGGVGGGRLFEGGRLLTFSAFRMGAYPRWALIRGSALIRTNTVLKPNVCNFFFSWDLAAVRIIGVSVIARCPHARREYFSPISLICSFFYSEHRRFGIH